MSTFSPYLQTNKNNHLNADISSFVFFISFKQQKVSCGSLTLLFIKIRTPFHQVSLVQHTLEFHTQETLGFSPQWLSQNQLTSKISCYLNNLQPRNAKRNIFKRIKINLRTLPSIIELLLYPNELPTNNNNNKKKRTVAKSKSCSTSLIEHSDISQIYFCHNQSGSIKAFC